MSILNPKDDVKAIEPMLDHIFTRAETTLRSLIPELEQAMKNTLDGVKIDFSIQITRKDQ